MFSVICVYLQRNKLNIIVNNNINIIFKINIKEICHQGVQEIRDIYCNKMFILYASAVSFINITWCFCLFVKLPFLDY